MAKKTRKRNRAMGESAAWTAEDHAIRTAKQQRKLVDDKQEARERRTAILTRNSMDKKEESKLRLHIARTQRQVEKLRERLSTWDDVEEESRRVLDEAERKRLEAVEQQQQSQQQPARKKGRKGPETWKLKGAARPAWEVYDFDTRYVDKHIKAHEEAQIKAKRIKNILALHKGHFGEENGSGPPQPYCRDFLALLMQLGHLNMQAKKFKAARAAFMECMELDSDENPVTPARCHLMRLHLEANRPDSARRLWERLPPNDPSVWIRYSAALVEYISWKILKEKGATQTSAESLLAKAIQANVFCAYYLAFDETFYGVMDYADDIEDADETSPLEEAIEYCCSEQMGAWKGTDGALEWVRDVVLRAIHGYPVADGELSPTDLDWRTKLLHAKATLRNDELFQTKAEENSKEQESHKNQDSATAKSAGAEEDNDDENDDDSPTTDVGMFVGMFQTAMEMLEDSGSLQRKPEE